MQARMAHASRLGQLFTQLPTYLCDMINTNIIHSCDIYHLAAHIRSIDIDRNVLWISWTKT